MHGMDNLVPSFFFLKKEFWTTAVTWPVKYFSSMDPKSHNRHTNINRTTLLLKKHKKRESTNRKFLYPTDSSWPQPTHEEFRHPHIRFNLLVLAIWKLQNETKFSKHYSLPYFKMIWNLKNHIWRLSRPKVWCGTPVVILMVENTNMATVHNILNCYKNW